MTEPSSVVEIRTAPAQVVEVLASQAVLVEVSSAMTAAPAAEPAGTGYRYEQTQPATVWTIDHYLGYDPGGISVVSDDGYLLDDFGVQYLMPDRILRLSFDIPVAGVAYLS